VKAREFLAQQPGEVELRNVIKQPLTAAELRALAQRAGGPKDLVAPKRRAEAEGLDGEALIAWLAAEPLRLRKPIIDRDGQLLLGFNAQSIAALVQ
jgi:arsenate reductase-like glutaredoxin family protein